MVKSRQPRAAILDALHLEAEVGQRLGDLLDRGVGLEVILQPGEGEFHLYRLRRVSGPAALSQGQAEEKSGDAVGGGSAKSLLRMIGAPGRRCRVGNLPTIPAPPRKPGERLPVRWRSYR
jgi:hypothetical protein